MKRIVFVLLAALMFGLYFFSCNNKPSESTLNSPVDSTLVGSENSVGPSNEEATMEEGPGGYVAGTAIEFETAGRFLSTMLYHTTIFQNYGEGNSVINVKLMKNKYSPVSVSQEFTPEYAIVKCGAFNEGFGGLKDAIMMCYDGSNDKDIYKVMLEMSGLPLRQTKEHSQPFTYVNSQVIDWCWRNFYREPKASSVGDLSLNTIYDVIFKRFVRTLAVSHSELNGGYLENEVMWYKNAIIMEKGYAPELLNKRYVKPDKYSDVELNSYYYPQAMGFWIRRSIDDSRPVLWGYLRTIIMDYDYEWGCKNLGICDRG